MTTKQLQLLWQKLRLHVELSCQELSCVYQRQGGEERDNKNEQNWENAKEKETKEY